MCILQADRCVSITESGDTNSYDGLNITKPLVTKLFSLNKFSVRCLHAQAL